MEKMQNVVGKAKRLGVKILVALVVIGFVAESVVIVSQYATWKTGHQVQSDAVADYLKK